MSESKTPEKKSTDSVDEKKKIEQKKKILNDEFKRKYFEFYDDIKISDRQDW